VTINYITLALAALAVNSADADNRQALIADNGLPDLLPLCSRRY
jgi:hypothetical protein